MTNELQEAFIILFVGMMTVFFILFLVVVTGNVLLRWLKSTEFVFNKEESARPDDTIPNELIEQAIRKWSGGKAVVKSIKKV
jgi:Na+-transporting methylmalonyl-CoA/oxaloacetate decarboxylase gamma subunit